MPPAAALECERTGCTLLMIATVAPALAAARAARCPASPAPMMRTSCAGMGGKPISRFAPLIPSCSRGRLARYDLPRAPDGRIGAPFGSGRRRRAGDPRSGRSEPRAQRLGDLLGGDDAPQAAVRVHGHQGPEPAQRL